MTTTNTKNEFNKADFIKKAHALYDERYDYSSINYVDSNTPIDIVCPEHGIFTVKPISHLKGQQCHNCRINDDRQRRGEFFVSQANDIHGNKYDYSQMQYINVANPISIICPEHGAFSMSPQTHLKGSGCPKCDGREPIAGENDLGTLFPFLASEWNTKENGDLKPENFLPNSSKKVHWLCPLCGKDYTARISDRTKYNARCSHCNRVQFSFAEKCLSFYIRKFSSYDVQENYIFSDSSGPKNFVEADILIEEIKTIIEYDGIYWHELKKNSSEREQYKDSFFHERGYRIIRVKERLDGDVEVDGNIIYYNERKPHSVLDDAISILLDMLNIAHNRSNISIDDDYALIYKNYVQHYRERSLAEKYPEIAIDWDYDKNEGITPYNVLPRNMGTFWWKCHIDGYPYRAQVHKQVERGRRCPVCNRVIVVTGLNDLASRHPDIAAEWNYDKNGDLKPETIMHDCSTIVWWKRWDEKYNKYREWRMSVKERVEIGDDFVFSYKGGITPGVNDIGTLCPNVATYFNVKRNKEELGIDLEQIKPRSTKVVWWHHWSEEDQCYHEWKRRAMDQTKATENGNPCPICAGSLIVPGINDLETIAPDIAAQWSPKNELDKYAIHPFGGQKPIWQHECNGTLHEWDAVIRDRVTRKTGCPICANIKLLQGFNDMVTVYPQLVEAWSDKNDIQPEELLCTKRDTEILWHEICGHEFKRTIASKLKRKDPHYCAVCYGDILVLGENDLATVYPEIAEEWDYEKNGDLTPRDIVFNSREKYYFITPRRGSRPVSPSQRVQTKYKHSPTIKDKPSELVSGKPSTNESNKNQQNKSKQKNK